MSLHADLLEQAKHLAIRETRRPKQASLRRAVSAAYYSVFHLITMKAVQKIGGDLTPPRRALMQRWFNHAEMKKICRLFLKTTFEKPTSLKGFQPSSDLQVVARNFIRLQEARHQADYDVAVEWTRLSVKQQLRLAQEVLESWRAIDGTEEANLFVLALLMWKDFEAERE